MLPQTLLNSRPVTTKQADGTYREPYADGGKRVHERTFPIMFLETNEFAWIPNTELTPLTPDMCHEAVEKGKQQKTLLAAYRVALENHDLQYFKNLLADHQRAMQQEAEDREARAAAKERKKKKKRKSMEVVDEADDVDDQEVELAEEEGPAKVTKKRKKDVESDGEAEPVKTTKLKLTTPKTPTETKRTPAKATRGRATGGRRGKAVSDDDETAVETPKEPEKTTDPQDAKMKKQKESTLPVQAASQQVPTEPLTKRQSSTSGTSCRKASSRATRRPRRRRWRPCPTSSPSSRRTPTSRCPSSAPPRSTRCSR
ncbi:hypothetical protein VTN02DRAFT_602 [Thermoascus thermophilus]